MTRVTDLMRTGMDCPMHEEIDGYWTGLIDTLRMTSRTAVAQVAGELYACYQRGGTVFVLGNGGSAATASHLACDLAKGTRDGGLPTFKVLSLTDNIPLLTAWSNDESYECALSEQLSAFIQPNDLVLAISTSGNSPNVVGAVDLAQRTGARTVALTGRTGGRLAAVADVLVRVPSDSIEQVEDAHSAIAHTVCVALRSRIQADRSLPIPHDLPLEMDVVTD